MRQVFTDPQVSDQQYWTRFVDQLIGDWLAPDTPIAEVCDFAHRMQRCHEAQQLCGDPKFLEAQRAYAKLRSAIDVVQIGVGRQVKGFAIPGLQVAQVSAIRQTVLLLIV